LLVAISLESLSEISEKSEEMSEFFGKTWEIFGETLEIFGKTWELFCAVSHCYFSADERVFELKRDGVLIGSAHAYARTHTTAILRFLLSQPSQISLQSLEGEWIITCFRTEINRKKLKGGKIPRKSMGIRHFLLVFLCGCEWRLNCPFNVGSVKVVKAKKRNLQGRVREENGG